MAAFITPIFSLLDRILPDKAQNDAAKAQLLQLQVNGELQNTIAQIQTNTAEAQSKSVFVAGWRPFIGWVCGSAFAYSYILHPITLTLLAAFHVNFDRTLLPVINTSEMMPVLLGMLGLGGYRTWEKINGVQGTGH